MQLGHSDFQAVSEALRTLYAHTDARTLPHCIVRLLRRMIPANSAAYNSFDFRTGEMQVVHDHGPDGDRYLPALNAHIQEHPLLSYLRLHWREGAAGMSDAISQRQLHDTAIYCEFLHPLNIEQQLGVMVEDRDYGIAAIGIQRDGRDFSARDKDMLTFLQPHIIQAFKNASDMTAARRRASGLNAAVGSCDLGVVWLSPNEKIDWMSSRAEHWLSEYFSRNKDVAADGLPTAIADWIRNRRAAQQSNSGTGWRAERTVVGRHGELNIRWVSESPQQSYLILSERRHQSPSDLLSLGLTARESEVLHWIAEGKSNEAISILLSASKRTIDKHVERILAKLGVETRVEAALRAAEHRR